MLLPHEIRKKEFSLAMGGYARSEVKSYLEYIADNYEKLRRENDELSRRLDAAMEKLDQYHASEMAALSAGIDGGTEPAEDEKTAAVAAVLSSLQLEVDMISARIGELNAFLGGAVAEEAECVDETEEIEEIAPSEEIDETADVETVGETEETEEETEEEIDEIDEIAALDEVDDEIEELAVLDEAESELELLDEVEDEVEETEGEEADADADLDGVLVFEIPVSASEPETIIAEEIIEEAPAAEEEAFGFVESEPDVIDDAPEAEDDSEPEQIVFEIAEDVPEETEDADEAEAVDTDEQLDIDDFLTEFFDMDDAIGDASGEDVPEFVTPEEASAEVFADEAPAEEIEAEIPTEIPVNVPKKTAVKRFHIKKKKTEPVNEAVEPTKPTEENPDGIIASLSEIASDPVDAGEADFVEAEPAAPETAEDDDLEAILKALKVQYESVTATASAEDENFDVTDFDEFNYIFGDSSSKIDTVPTKNDIDDVLYDE